MTENLIAQLLSALNAAGFPSYSEYPAMQMPNACFFITAAANECRFGEAVPCTDGTAAPAAVTLRLRYHCKPDADFELHAAEADSALYSALLAANCDIRGAQRDPMHYNKLLDRTICETRIELNGLLRAEQEADHAAN